MGAKPEHRNTFVKAMKRHQKVTIQEEGVVAVPHFKLHTSPFDDHVFYLVEEWASEADGGVLGAKQREPDVCIALRSWLRGELTWLGRSSRLFGLHVLSRQCRSCWRI